MDELDRPVWRAADPPSQHRRRRGVREQADELPVVGNRVVVLQRRHQIGRVIEAEGHGPEDPVARQELVVERGAAEWHGDVDGRPDEGRPVHEALRQLGRVVTPVAVETEHEVGLDVRHVLAEPVEVLHHPIDLLDAGGPSHSRLVRVVRPGLDARCHQYAVRLAQPSHPVRPQHAQRALHHVARTLCRRKLLEHPEHLIEADRKVGIVEHDAVAGQVPGDVAKIGGEPIERKVVIGPVPIAAEVAPVRTADAREHRDGREGAPLAAEEGRCPDLRHALLDGRHVREGPTARDERAGIHVTGEDLADQGLVALLDDDVEEA